MNERGFCYVKVTKPGNPPLWVSSVPAETSPDSDWYCMAQEWNAHPLNKFYRDAAIREFRNRLGWEVLQVDEYPFKAKLTPGEKSIIEQLTAGRNIVDWFGPTWEDGKGPPIRQQSLTKLGHLHLIRMDQVSMGGLSTRTRAVLDSLEEWENRRVASMIASVLKHWQAFARERDNYNAYQKKLVDQAMGFADANDWYGLGTMMMQAIFGGREREKIVFPKRPLGPVPSELAGL